MITIYKYPIELVDIQTLELPYDHQILDVQYQGPQLFLWARIDTTNKSKSVNIHCFSTGYEIPNIPLAHLKTIQDGTFVWHFFEEFQRPAQWTKVNSSTYMHSGLVSSFSDDADKQGKISHGS